MKMRADDYTINPEPAQFVAAESISTDKSSGLSHIKESENKAWKIIAVISFFVALVSLIMAVSSLMQAYQNVVSIQTSSMGYQGPTSCKSVKGPTGIYYIKTDPYFNSFPVYCDMVSAGGGWTLVAAVHENNIYGKCTLGDKWSSEQGYSVSSVYNGTGNWENINIFGSLNTLTYEDYKNMAYYAIEASDVMIWHVPNNLELYEFSSKAFLKYHTTNGFLRRYGGTLQSLYANYAPMIHAGSSRFFELIAFPVTYLKGNDSVIMDGIPLGQKGFVEPGYLQFRAFDEYGFPNALCPGIRMMKGDSAKVCIGGGGAITGISFGIRKRSAGNNCGDYAAWGGKHGDPGNLTSPSATGRSLKDINSSIFIFTK